MTLRFHNYLTPPIYIREQVRDTFLMPLLDGGDFEVSDEMQMSMTFAVGRLVRVLISRGDPPAKMRFEYLK